MTIRALVRVWLVTAVAMSGLGARAAEPADLTARLQALEDYVRIEQLLMRYAHTKWEP